MSLVAGIKSLFNGMKYKEVTRDEAFTTLLLDAIKFCIISMKVDCPYYEQLNMRS